MVVVSSGVLNPSKSVMLCSVVCLIFKDYCSDIVFIYGFNAPVKELWPEWNGPTLGGPFARAKFFDRALNRIQTQMSEH